MNEDKQVFVGQFEKNSIQIVKASLIPWKQDWFVDLRVWERIPDEGTERPTLRGIRLNVELIPELVRLLEDVRRAAESPSIVGRPIPG